MPRWPNFAGGADTGASLIGSAADTVNWYVERLPAGGANQACLLPMPGYQVWSTAPTSGAAPTGGTRALYTVPDVNAFGVATPRLFAVIGPDLWEFDAVGTPTARGTVGVDGHPAQIAFNGKIGGQLGIASNGQIFAYDLTTNTLTGPHLSGGYLHMGYAGGVGLAFSATQGTVRLSALEDFTSWDAGQFFKRSLFADPWIAMWVDQNNIVWLVGSDSFEAWYNTGQGTQPFAPLSGLVGALGIVGPFAYTMAQVGNVWLSRTQGGQGLLVSTRGGAPEVLSSRAMATAVADYARSGGVYGSRLLSDTELVHHVTEAHPFTNVTFPGEGTWCYDHLEQVWTRRGQWNAGSGTYDIWPPRVQVSAFGRALVGTRDSGQLWEMDRVFGTEIDGTGIRRLRRAPALVNEKKRAPIDQLEILMDVGLGGPPGPPPTLGLRVSDDGGRTWSPSLSASTGAAGAWRTRVYWTRLGLVNEAVIELTSRDTVPRAIVDAYLNNIEAA